MSLGRGHSGGRPDPTQTRAAGSSKSSNTITPARVPDPDSTLPNFSRTYYARLRKELTETIGLPSVSLYGED